MLNETARKILTDCLRSAEHRHQNATERLVRVVKSHVESQQALVVEIEKAARDVADLREQLKE